MSFDDLHSAAAAVPDGAWAVGVSGGADSVALLRLLTRRSDLRLHVVHLDHQLRGADSDTDAAFASSLAEQLSLRFTISRASEVSLHGSRNLPANTEARGRALRRALFVGVIASFKLDGVILGHHADDQAETVFMRMLRGSSLWTMRGMAPDSRVGTLRLLRPLLQSRRERLRAYLQSIAQPWREDASNNAMTLTRNRVRRLLARHPQLFDRAIELAQHARRTGHWIEGVAAPLPDVFHSRELSDCATVIARWSAVRWLIARGAPPQACSGAVADRLIDMCRDAASPPRQHFPGGIEVRRRAKLISATRVAVRRGAPAA